jgi:hypothetical protein
LLLSDIGETSITVVELQYINYGARGTTASTKRTYKKKKVKDQAKKYGKYWKKKYADAHFLVVSIINSRDGKLLVEEVKE